MMLHEIIIAERTGWSRKEITDMGFDEIFEIEAVIGALDMYRAKAKG